MQWEIQSKYKGRGFRAGEMNVRVLILLVVGYNALKCRALVNLSIKEISFINISLNLNINDGSQIALKVIYYFRSESLYSGIFNPLVNVIGGLKALCPTM